MIGAKSWIDAQDRDHAFHHEPGADQKDTGERNFRDNEGAAHPARRRTGIRAAGLVQKSVHVRTRGLQRRDDTEKDTGNDRDADSKKEHRHVELNIFRPCDASGA